MSAESIPEILYIEDDPLTAKRVLSSLARSAFNMTHVTSGLDALEQFQKRDFDLVALDLVLPDMDGNDVIRKMKEIRALPPTVVITGFGDEQTVVDVMHLGATDYVPKDTDGRYIILLPTVFEKAIYQGRMNTLKRSIEQELSFSRENFRNLLNTSSDFIFVIDDDGKILNYNPALQKGLGYSVDELRAMTIYDLHPPGTRDELTDTLARMLEGDLDSCDFPMIRKSGELLEIESRISKGQWGGKQVVYIITRDMSEQRRTVRELRESRKMLELVMDNIPEHIFWKDPQLRYIGCNENYARSVGYECLDDLIGKTDDELEGVVTPPDILERQRRIIETGETELHATLRVNNPEGHEVIFDVNRIPLRNDDDAIIGLLSTREDVTDRVFIEQQLLERERILSAVTTNMKDLVALVDSQINFSYVSQSYFDVLGMEPESLLGTSVLNHMHPEDIGIAQNAVATAVTEKKAQRAEFRYRHKNGNYLWLESIGVPVIMEDGEVQSYVLVSRDMSDRKEFEKRILDKSAELEESNEELDAFSHTVAHDLKNPLNSILGLANLLRENIEMSEEEITDSLKFIEQSATNMNGIIDSLMVLAGVRQQEIAPEYIDMAEVVEHTLGRLTFYMHDMKAVIRTGALPPCLGYGPWIQEVWVNYITNAVKYGGTPPEIRIGGDVLEDGRVKYWVKDNGPGISEEDQKRLFVPFSRLRQVSVKGYGLGLSIVTRIIDRLDGEVGIHSVPGEGATFYFILPGAPAEHPIEG